MYSDNLGTLHTYSTTWTLITYANIDTLFKRKYTIEENFEILKKNCERISSKCKIIQELNQITAKLSKIAGLEAGFQELSELQLNNRQKRAPLEFIGSINKALFGTPDADEMRKIYNQIETVSNSTEQITSLLVNRTVIIKSKFIESQKQIEQLKQTIETAYFSVERKLNSINASNHIIEINNENRRFVNAINEDLTDYEIDVHILLDALIFAKIGQIHPQILKVHEIRQQAEKMQVTTQYASLFQSQNLIDIIKLADIVIFYAKGKLIFHVQFPLIDSFEYNLFSHLSLPIKQNNKKFAYIKPSSKLSGVSKNFETYFNIRIEQLEVCKQQETRYICKLLFPIYSINSDSPCEIQLLTNPQFNNISECDIRLKEMRTAFWSEIHNTNSWLFSMASPEALYITERNQKTITKIIDGTGILHLNPNTIAKTHTITLHPLKQIVSIHVTNYTQNLELNITNLLMRTIPDFETIDIVKLLSEIKTNDFEDTQLEQVISKAHEIHKNIQLSRKILKLENAFRYTGFSLGPLILILGIMWKFSLFGKLFEVLKFVKRIKIFGLCTKSSKKQRKYENKPKKAVQKSAEIESDEAGMSREIGIEEIEMSEVKRPTVKTEEIEFVEIKVPKEKFNLIKALTPKLKPKKTGNKSHFANCNI